MPGPRAWRHHAKRSLAVAAVGAMAVTGPVAVGTAVAAPTTAAGDSAARALGEGLNGPRGLTILPRGRMAVSQADGSFGKLIRKGPRRGEFVPLGRVPAAGIAPALGSNAHGRLFILTGGSETGELTRGMATLFRYNYSEQRRQVVANIARYQQNDPDPYDLEQQPTESNPFGVAGLPDHSALVSDAAGNDLLRVYPDGRVVTVARLKPRVVASPDLGPEGPPPGTMMPSEAVATSVTVGSDGAYYVGELRGFPATPGTSQVWRIEPGTTDAVCDPEHPNRGACTRFADGFTSIVSLGAGRHGSIYVAELSKLSWLALESDPPIPGAEVGSVYKIERHSDVRRELKPGQVILPGSVAVGRRSGRAFVSGPIFGPGQVMPLNRSRHS